MLSKVKKVFDNLPMVLLAITVVFGFSINLHAQTPTINPEQTVNPATGEMATSIPLGGIDGIGGLGYSANLNYHAGIRTTDEASAAGLGFGYEPGSVTRKVVYVPDDNTGGDSSYFNVVTDGDCDIPWWQWAIAIGSIIIGIVAMIVFPVSELAVFSGISGIMSSILISISAMVQVEFNTKDYLAGGLHDNAYSAYASEHGKGFMKGATGDLPDMYFLQTPYIRGIMRPTGAADTNGNVNFKLAVSDGSPGSKAKIVYNINSGEFRIIMEDGTRIFLGGTDEAIRRNTMTTTKVLTSEENNGVKCYRDEIIQQRENVPSEWLLRKVLGPDYHDGDSDNNPLTNPKLDRGAWIAFCYSKTTTPNARRLPMTVQGGPNTTIVSYNGYEIGNEKHYTLEDIYLDSVRTPLGKVHYKYRGGRLDDVWFADSDFVWSWNERNEDPDNEEQPPASQIEAVHEAITPIDRKVLDTIVFYNADNVALRTAVLKTFYRLRPNSFYSMKKNTGRSWFAIDMSNNINMACLTLDSLQIYDNAMGNMMKTKFFYDYNPDGLDPNNSGMPENVPKPLKFHLEPRDGWGYHRPARVNNVFKNDFNFSGEKRKAMDTLTGKTYSAAWSMTSMVLPSGMRLAWEYESSRFGLCNNIQVSSTDDNPRYGGGPRVKKVIIDPSGNSQPTTLTYFYTSDSLFVENKMNSSGHATVQPFSYLEISVEGGNDLRNEKTRGSFYTPTKVCYQKVKIVKNYVSPTLNKPDGQAPLGYTENVYITSGTFPNNGKFGQIDESWRRGMLSSVTQKSASKKTVSQSVNYYRWIPNATYTPVNNTYLTGGTVLLTSQRTTANGVVSNVNYSYAGEVDGAGADAVDTTCNIFNYAIVPGIDPGNGFSVKGSFSGTAGETYKDMITILHQGRQLGTDTYIDNLKVSTIWDYDKPNKVPMVSDTFILFHNHQSLPSTETNHRFKRGCFKFDSLKLWIEDVNATTINVYISIPCYEEFTDSISHLQTYGIIQHYVKITGVTSNGSHTVTTGDEFNPNGAPPPSGLDSVVLYFTNPDYSKGNIHFTNHGEALIDCKHTFIADRDGKPNRTTTTNSDGKSLIKEMIPAFTQSAYSTMLTDNILTPVCRTMTFGKGPGTTDVPYVVSAQATTWSKTLGTPAWAPCSTFVWKANLQSNGLPDKIFADFDHTPGAANPNWQYTGNVTKYNANSQAVETSKPTSTATSGRIRTVTVYGHGHTLPIGSIVNADFRESGVFTCDYNLNEAGSPHNYFDKDNGWEIGVLDQPTNPPPTGSISAASPHFGQNSLHMANGEGLMRSFKVRGSVKYELSLWVKVTSGSMPIRVEYRKETSPITDWPVQYNHPSLPPADASNVETTSQGTTNGAWRLVKVPARVLSGGDNWIRISIGFHGASFDAYVDDVRFAPANAMTTSTYYDLMWRQPVLSIDENDNPGRLSEYDSFGRLSHVYKYNKSMGSQETGAKTLVLSKAYHLMGAGIFRPSNPVPANESVILTRTVVLSWTVPDPLGKLVDYIVYWGTNPGNLLPIDTVSGNTHTITNLGFGVFYWQIGAHEVGSGTIQRGPVWSFNADYKRPPFDDLVSHAFIIPNDSTYRTISWNRIISPVGLDISYFIRYNGTGDFVDPSYNCYPDSCVCRSREVGPGQGFYHVKMKDGIDSATSIRFEYPTYVWP